MIKYEAQSTKHIKNDENYRGKQKFREEYTPQGIFTTQQDPAAFFPFYELLLNYYIDITV
jgi:hypothetical protein